MAMGCGVCDAQATKMVASPSTRTTRGVTLRGIVRSISRGWFTGCGPVCHESNVNEKRALAG